MVALFRSWMWNMLVGLLAYKECDALIIPRSEFLQQSLLGFTISSSITPSSPWISVEEEALLCRNGALIPEQAVPGAYSNSCMALPRRIVPLQVPCKKNAAASTETTFLTISQEASGSGKTGLAVWNSGLLLTRVLQSLALEIPQWFARQERMLELGCGTAVVSIACHRLGAPYVLATDGNPDVVRLANQNIETNQQPMPILGSSSDDTKADTSPMMSSIEAKPLQWGLLNAMDYSETADLVLGSDLTYNSGTWRVLAETMEAVLTPTGTVLYLSLGHEGFNVNAEVDGFLSVAKEMGLEPVSEIGGEAGENAIPVSSLVSSTVSSQEEFKQLQLSGGAKIIALQRKQMRRNS